MTVEDKFKKLGSSDVITSKLDQIIDAFVAYYGEDRREEITNKFKNLLILKFSNVSSYIYNTSEIPSALLREIFNMPQDEKFFWTVEDYDNFCKYLEDEVEDKGYIMDPDMLERVTGNPSADLHYNYHKGAYPKLEEFIKKYKELRPRLTPYIEHAHNEIQKMSEVELKYYKMLLEEFKYIFDEEDIKTFESTGMPSKAMMILLGPIVNPDGNCFDNDSEKALHDHNAPIWLRNNIILDRTKLISVLYKPQDEQNHSNYQSYLKDPECAELIKKLKVVGEQISKREKELHPKMRIEQVESLDDYKINRAEINKMNFIDSDDVLGVHTYFSSVACLNYNFIKTPNGIIPYPIIMINSSFDELDLTIIHELNHALELHFIEFDEHSCHAITGWDESKKVFNDGTEDRNKQYEGISRNYELISEFVNDRLSEEITTLMHSQGNYIFDISNKSKSDYQQVKLLLEPFYQKFKEILIKSRSHGNIDYLFEQIGKENFDELADLTNKFFDAFKFKLDVLKHYIERKKKNEDTTLFYEMMNKRDEIISKMEEHLHKKSL